MPSDPHAKDELLKELQRASAELDRVLHDLPPGKITDTRDHARWSIQDHLDHLAVWEEGIAALLERSPRWEAMGVDVATVARSDPDQVNAIIRARTPKRTLAETRAALRESHDHLLRALRPLTDADLLKTYSHYQPDEPGEDRGNPIIRWIVGNSSVHYREHLPWIEAILKQGKRA